MNPNAPTVATSFLLLPATSLECRYVAYTSQVMSAHVSLGSQDQYEPHASLAHTAPLMSPAVSSAKPAPRHRYAKLSISRIRSAPANTGLASSGNSPASITAATVPSTPTRGLFRRRTLPSDSASSDAIVAASAASPAASTDSFCTRPSRKPSAPFAPSNPCVASTSRNDTHDRDPTSSVAYESIITLTCIMSQLLFSAGTSAEARCSSGGSARVAPATTMRAVGAASAPGTALLLYPSLSVTTRCTPVTPHARKSSDSYMLERGKCPDSTQRAARSEARVRLPASMAYCSGLPARFSSVKNAL
mmetsp:Transcript_5660/g.23250  ORF Transcript_5660/g.23250 Transcript_5660/m.23250 type:complete len:304 (+) Transcript_5660:3374-4285(+)